MKKLAGFLTLIGFVVLAAYAWNGGFRDLTVKEESFGPYHFVYMDHVGAYRETGKIYQELDTLFSEKKIAILGMAGLYYDNPGVVEDAKLRSSIGAVVDKKLYDSIKLPKMKKKIISKRSYIYTDFPFTNYISMVIGIKKAYPVLGEYARSQNFPKYEYREKNYTDQFSMEIYYPEYIRFMMPKP